MARYVYFSGNSKPGTKSITAAKKAVRDQGASVVGTASAKRIARVLRGWDYTAERLVT